MPATAWHMANTSRFTGVSMLCYSSIPRTSIFRAMATRAIPENSISICLEGISAVCRPVASRLCSEDEHLFLANSFSVENGRCIVEPKLFSPYESELVSLMELARALDFLIHICVEERRGVGGFVRGIG